MRVGIVQKVKKLTKLSLCQSNSLTSESFWQKNSLSLFTFFWSCDICLFKHLYYKRDMVLTNLIKLNRIKMNVPRRTALFILAILGRTLDWHWFKVIRNCRQVFIICKREKNALVETALVETMLKMASGETIHPSMNAHPSWVFFFVCKKQQ